MIQKKTVSNAELIPEIARLVKEGNEVIFTPKGASMLPFIRGERDRVMLRDCPAPKQGDIVLALTKGSRYVLHRIISIDGDRIILMGDGNIAGRETCTKEGILAVVIRILKDGKEIDCQSASHMRKAALWRRLLPVRRLLLAIYKKTLL